MGIIYKGGKIITVTGCDRRIRTNEAEKSAKEIVKQGKKERADKRPEADKNQNER